MGMHVDEARQHDAAVEIEAWQAVIRSGCRADGGDAALVDHDVAGREAVGVGLQLRGIGHETDRHARIGEAVAR